ncbi:hypothetical protein Hypma_000838 [Hypsizygus marmoreus]|uniref:Uncharacterized protein n=1 Tax=Hypsizygus marmoreus TaxID=39966 RepID=A0A369J7V7_HYPMA|nr:hypothetical protein Hypma_000838 [Hypsizygus marmoreus]
MGLHSRSVLRAAPHLCLSLDSLPDFRSNLALSLGNLELDSMFSRCFPPIIRERYYLPSGAPGVAMFDIIFRQGHPE